MHATTLCAAVLAVILRAATAAAQPDINCDRALSAADVAATIAELGGAHTSCGSGDANCDGHVDGADVDDVVHALFGAAVCTPRIPSTTRVLDADTTAHLVTVDDAGTLHFERSSPMLETLTPGDVVVSGVTDALADGLLRKVVSVTTENGAVAVATVPTTLEEAIQDGTTAIRVHLDPASLDALTLPDNVVARAGFGPAETQGFFFEIRDFVVYDADGNEETTNDQVRVTGSVALDPTIDFLLDISSGRLRRFRFAARQTEAVEVEGTVTIPFLTPNEAKIEKVRPVAILAPFVIFVGPFPIVIRPQINLIIGVMAELFTAVRCEASQQSVLSLGVQFENDAWSPIADFSADLGFRPPMLTTGVDVDMYAGAELEAKLYGIAGPHVAAKGFAELDADLARTPWWELYGGVRADSGARLAVFSTVLADVDFPGIVGYRRLLAQADTPPPPQGLTGEWRISVQPFAGEPAACVPATFAFDVSGSDDQLHGSISASGCSVTCGVGTGDCTGTTDGVLSGAASGSAVQFSVTVTTSASGSCPDLGCGFDFAFANAEQFTGTVLNRRITGTYQLDVETCSFDSNCAVTSSPCPAVLGLRCQGTFAVDLPGGAESSAAWSRSSSARSPASAILGLDLTALGSPIQP